MNERNHSVMTSFMSSRPSEQSLGAPIMPHRENDAIDSSFSGNKIKNTGEVLEPKWYDNKFILFGSIAIVLYLLQEKK